jgi:hypothetical protein
LAIGALIFSLVILISSKSSSVENIDTIGVIALFAGLIFATIVLSNKLKTVLYALSYALIISLITLIPAFVYQETASALYFKLWPYCFLVGYLLMLVSIFDDKIQPKLTEGITLLLSISVIYWSFDNRLLFTQNMYLKVLLFVGLLFCLFSVYNAFTKAPLYAENRFVLSLWCSIMLFIFTIDNVHNMLVVDEDEQSVLYHSLQYFSLGISSIYIFQNIIMLIAFLPAKERPLLSEEYADQVDELAQSYIKRFSDKQVNTKESLFCILFTIPLFTVNYFFNILPAHIAIWLVIFVFPYAALLFGRFSRK